MSRPNSFASAVPALWSRWSPILAMGLGLLWFVLVAPLAIASGRWCIFDVMQGHPSQDLARLLLRAAAERPDLWPDPAVCDELHRLFLEQQERKSREWRCHSAVERTLEPRQLAVVSAGTAGPGVGVGYQSISRELHAVNEVLQSMVGSAPVRERRDPDQQSHGSSLRGSLRGLLSLAEGQGPGLTEDQARVLLPVCLEAELVSVELPKTDEALEALLSPELRDWMSATEVPSGYLLSTQVLRCLGSRTSRLTSETDAVLFVLREGPGAFAGCDWNWDEPPGAVE